MIKEEFQTITVVKGRAYHPASQGSVEQGNVTFNEALDKWLEEEDNRKDESKKKSWSQVGVYMINAKINNHPSRSKDKKVHMKFTMEKSHMVHHLTYWTTIYLVLPSPNILFW